MNSVRSNNLSLKNQRFTLSGCSQLGIRQFKFVTNTHNSFKPFYILLINPYSCATRREHLRSLKSKGNLCIKGSKRCLFVCFLDHNSGTDLPQIMVGELKRITGMFLFHGLKIPRGNIVLRQSWVSSEEIVFNLSMKRMIKR